MSSQPLPAIPTQLFINNEYIDSTSPNRLTVVNPYTGTQIPHAAHAATKHDIDAAVSAAQSAYKTTWAQTSPREKQACMLRFADLVEKHAERLAILESLPTGKPVTPTMQFDIAHMVEVYRYYAGWTDKLPGESYPASNGVYKIVRHEPLGVCAGIASWNATFLYIGWKIAPAVAAGNCFIFKPSEKSPFGALALGALFAEAGFPPGVVQIVNGGQETGSLLASHSGIAKISFTGSIGGGRAVQDAASKSNLKKVTLELGGKSPAIVFGDVDLQRAVGGVCGFLFNSGQVCVATSRVLVHSSIITPFTAALKTAFEEASATLGADPLDKSTVYGPVVDKAQFDKIMSYIAIGKETATLLTGGAQEGDRGYFIQPTIFVDPQPDSPILKEEIFGPVLAIQSFETEEEAVALANASDYGLAASIYTSNIDRALRVSSQLECGGVAINSPFIPELQTPFGGVKASGQGKELGKEGLLEYTEAKSIHIRLDVAKL
ncbi:aldehyde dehydrogenase domain-containing protein [Aspergillus karnatakaensis]|uniref:aldehyde dehydrogenase domain-containing protein n=1 Tax=Aspergillus karnatakaensis TaxID=1810916 RepID=UPI003CCDC324